MAGYYNVRLNEGVHNDLYAKALVLEKDGSAAAVVACDLIAAPWPMVEAARELIEKSTSLPGGHVMISATHTHTGPVMSAHPRGADRRAIEIAKNYHANLPARIAECVRLAEADLQPARARAGIGHEDSVSFIRRFLMKDGSVGWNPGKLKPGIVRPMSTIDPEVPVVYFESPESEPLATCVNFANHLDTVGGLRFSADYPYTIAKLLGMVKGPKMLTLFTLGACGNINHIDVKRETPQKGHEEAARIGTILARAVLKTYWRLEPVEPGPVVVRRGTVEIPVVKVTADEVAEARKAARTFGTSDAPPFYEQVNAFKVLAAEKEQGKPIEAEPGGLGRTSR